MYSQGGPGATLPIAKYWIIRGTESDSGRLITGRASVTTLLVPKAFQ